MCPRKFEIFLIFPKILSLKSFGNSWGNSYQVYCTRYQVSFYLWWIGSVLKYCKVPKYYGQDCRLSAFVTKSSNSLQNSLNPICNCVEDIETLADFLLHYPDCLNERSPEYGHFPRIEHLWAHFEKKWFAIRWNPSLWRNLFKQYQHSYLEGYDRLPNCY